MSTKSGTRSSVGLLDIASQIPGLLRDTPTIVRGVVTGFGARPTAKTSIGKVFQDRAARYARERTVFGRPIGQNQAIQHPLAECWAQLESAWLTTLKAAWLYDNGRPCGAEANAAKLLGGRAGHQACLQAVLTHGGMGYAKEYVVERLLREVTINRIAPVSEQLVLSFIAERVLGLPR